MDKKNRSQYEPDFVSCPGETLEETLSTIGMKQSELAERTGRPKKTINEIIKGKTAITPETALQLEKVLRIPASFWDNREKRYRAYLARMQDQKEMANDLNWLKELPIRSMINNGWIAKQKDDAQQLNEVLAFFGVASREQWKTVWQDTRCSFRKSPAFESNFTAISAWLRKGELAAGDIECAEYDEYKFKEVIKDIRKLTLRKPEIYQHELIKLCAQCGVVIAFVPALPKIRLSGATRWLTAKKALIQLSLRYKSDDQLWFSFFHEAGHIILHGKREIFVEGFVSDVQKEDEANRFASDILIPKNDYKQFVSICEFSEQAIITFARRVGVAPSIVVGRLQHDGHVPHNYLNHLKTKLKWAI